jgi:hypothetical protein
MIYHIFFIRSVVAMKDVSSAYGKEVGKDNKDRNTSCLENFPPIRKPIFLNLA